MKAKIEAMVSAYAAILGIEVPQVEVADLGDDMLGQFDSCTGIVTINAQGVSAMRKALGWPLSANAQLGADILQWVVAHEVRHAWQFRQDAANLTVGDTISIFGLSRIERDADAWANYHAQAPNVVGELMTAQHEMTSAMMGDPFRLRNAIVAVVNRYAPWVRITSLIVQAAVLAIIVVSALRKK